VIVLVRSANVNKPNYQTGQIWKYRTRDGEVGSYLVILNCLTIENYGTVYSICIEGIKLKNPWLEGGIQTTLPHAPVSEAALDASVIEPIGIRENALSMYLTEFQEWKEPFDRHEAGVFTISVAEILDCVEQAASDAAVADYEEVEN
jgi:hypothetical protein